MRDVVKGSMRRPPLPYGRQTIAAEDIAAVVEVLRSDWLTTGPAVEAFEDAIATYTKTQHAVAVSSGTAALHAAMDALRIAPGDEVIVPALTFVATANAVVYCGGIPIFADVNRDTLLVDPDSVARKITSRTRAVVTVDYAGQPSEYDELRAICQANKLALVADSCHSLGATYKGSPIGSLADLTAFSFHPVKSITTGEGGMVTTNRTHLAEKIRSFRNHGITTDHRQRSEKGSFSYEMVELGFNYRITDMQCALGACQLRKLPMWVKQRQEIARMYDEQFKEVTEVRPLEVLAERSHAYHLYVIRVSGDLGASSRRDAWALLRERGIGATVHYMPVYMHPFYQNRFGYAKGLCPVAEAAYEEILTLPIFPRMHEGDVLRVVASLRDAFLNCGSSQSERALPKT